MNTETLNHVFTITDDGELESRPATEKEIENARRDFFENDYKFDPIGRSCWECNPAHVYHIERPAYSCFSCGKRFHKGVDILDYSDSEMEKHTHIDESKIQDFK